MYHWTDYIKNCLFVLMIVLVSCSRDNDNAIEDGIYVPLQIGDVSSDGIAFKGVSTPSETVLSTGDIGVFRLESTGYAETRNNVKYSYSSSSSSWDVDTDNEEPIYLTQDEANICAYYPYSSDDNYTDGNITLTSQVYSEGADLCYQTNVNANSGTKKVSFTMGHCYAKLILTFTHSASYTGYCFVKDISIENGGIMTSNTLDITSGSYGTGTTGKVTIPDIGCISSGTSVVVTVLMVPVSTLSGDITLSFNVDGQKVTKSHKITSLEAGSTHNIKVDIKTISVSKVTDTANCYIIAPFNSLIMPVDVKGNGGDEAGTSIGRSISPLSVGILWETSPDLISLGELSSDNEVTVTANSEITGNAVIAAYSGTDQTGDILWSWHIWVTDYDPDDGTIFTITNGASVDGVPVEYKFMDRNLGATTATLGDVTTMGLLYQWGRKDPFPGVSAVDSGDDATGQTLYNASGNSTSITKTIVSASSNLSNAIKNPFTFYLIDNGISYDWYSDEDYYNNALWNASSKTIFDPCPSGWRVPAWNGSASPWSAFTDDTFEWSDTDYGRKYSDSFYPAAGFMDRCSGKYSGVGSNGHYWSASTHDEDSYYLLFDSSSVNSQGYGSRAYGYSVRCVRE